MTYTIITGLFTFTASTRKRANVSKIRKVFLTQKQSPKNGAFVFLDLYLFTISLWLYYDDRRSNSFAHQVVTSKLHNKFTVMFR